MASTISAALDWLTPLRREADDHGSPLGSTIVQPAIERG
jgi:hypothetical protein